MPLYVYRCDAGHLTEEVRSVAARADVKTCPHTSAWHSAMQDATFSCGLSLKRVLVPCASIFPKAPSWRQK